MKKLVLFVLFLQLGTAIYAQTEKGVNSITNNELRSKVSFLASDLLEGREAGERGSFIAAEYIAARFLELGLKPLPTAPSGDFYQYFEPFEAYKIAQKKSTITIDGVVYKSGVDFTTNVMTQSAKLQGEVVTYNSANESSMYKDKIVVADCIFGTKEAKELASLGAKMIILTGEDSNQLAKKATQYHYNEAIYEGYEPRVTFYDTKLLTATKVAQTPIISVNSIVKEALEMSKTVKVSLNVDTQIKYLRNVIGMIEGENSDEYVVIGSHYDHLGNYDGYIYNGADDNASGVAAVMEIAEAFIVEGVKPARNVIFALWDGEERGLLGSDYFVNNFANIESVKSYLNFDMIGRSGNEKSGNTVSFMYTKSYPQFGDWLKGAVKDNKLDLKPNYSPWANPVGGSDNASFARKGIPIGWYHTGGHDDYHQPSDTADKIDWNKLLNIARSAYVVLFEMANE